MKMAKQNTALQSTYNTFVDGEYFNVYITFADYDTGQMTANCNSLAKNSNIVNCNYHRDGAPSTGTAFNFERQSDTWKLRADDFSYNRIYGTRYDKSGNNLGEITLKKPHT